MHIHGAAGYNLHFELCCGFSKSPEHKNSKLKQRMDQLRISIFFFFPMKAFDKDTNKTINNYSFLVA